MRAAALQWDHDSARELATREGSFDLVLSSDCIYAPLYGEGSSETLAEVIHTLCGPSTIAVIAVHHRPEEGAPTDGTMEFLTALKRYLQVTVLEAEYTGFHSDSVQVIEAKVPMAPALNQSASERE